MILAWHPLALLIVIFLIFGLATSIVNLLTVRRFDQYPQAEEFPFVSVLVPARNEAHNIEACVSSLLAQDYPNFEVIVLNDNSTDDTSRILNRLALNDTHLRVMKGAPLPENWIGKNWACHQLDKAATGELILFTDADTRHAPDTLRASVSALFTEHADLVTAFPHEEVNTWGERILLPVIGFCIFTFIPHRLVQKLRLPALAITIGQFMLFRRTFYDALGGYEAVRTEVVDDICLGRRVVASGGEWRLLNGTRHVSCRMYHGFWEAVCGFSKNIFAVFDFRILPFILSWLLMGVVFLMPAAALVSFGVFHHPMPSLPLEYAIFAVALSLLLWLIAYLRYTFPAYLIFVYPLSLALFIAVAVRSFFQSATGTAIWKGRVLERVAMRWL